MINWRSQTACANPCGPMRPARLHLLHSGGGQRRPGRAGVFAHARTARLEQRQDGEADLVVKMRAWKRKADSDLAILGSGSVVVQAAPAGLIEEFQGVVVPAAVGGNAAWYARVTAIPAGRPPAIKGRDGAPGSWQALPPCCA
jgi:hypothetical protein